MKVNAIVLFVVAVLAGCKEVTFREPQPKGRRSMHTIPARLQGKYLPYQENGELSKDTIVITARGYRFGYFEDIPRSSHHAHYDEGVLSDSLVLKSFRGYFFLNIYERPEWLLRIIRQEKNGDLVYMTLEQEGVDFPDYLRKLGYEMPIDSVKLEKETLYFIDPVPSQLIALIEKGFVTETPLKKVR